jgi:hypothetical protein
MIMPIIFTELYDTLREAGASDDDRARAAAVVRQDTQLQTSIDKRLAI